VADGNYWGAAGFLRDLDKPNFSEADVRFLVSLSEVIAEGLRRALLNAPRQAGDMDQVPGVVVFDEAGKVESISPAAESWIAQIVEIPPPTTPADSKALQAVAARARVLKEGEDPLTNAARSRVQTRFGRWLLLYGTPLSGEAAGRTAVIIQPAGVHEVAPLIALAYGLTEREAQIAQLCTKGQSTQEMASSLSLSAYTVQDHLKSIFKKTGVRSRGELVGQIFLEHYAPGWEDVANAPPGWHGLAEVTSGWGAPSTNAPHATLR
jgi:DNA-binding CsgD family transcriptional regulator